MTDHSAPPTREEAMAAIAEGARLHGAIEPHKWAPFYEGSGDWLMTNDKGEEVFVAGSVGRDQTEANHAFAAFAANNFAALLTLARAGAEWMFASEETVATLAKAIREEIVRQYRDDERRTFPGGSYHYEESQSPWLIARAALAALSVKE